MFRPLYRPPWRRRRLTRALAAAAAAARKHPRPLAVPAAGVAVGIAGIALRAAVGPWGAIVAAALVASVVAVAVWRAALPRRRAVGYTVALLAAVLAVGSGAIAAVVVVMIAVATTVVRLPRVEHVEHPDEFRELPCVLRPHVIAHRVRRSVHGVAAVAARNQTPRESGAETSTWQPRRPLRTAAGRPLATTETAAESLHETVETGGEADRVRAILAAADGAAVAPVELYRSLGISRATLHRRATDWIAQGWLERADGGYRLVDPQG